MSLWLSLLSSMIVVKDCQCADFSSIASVGDNCMFLCLVVVIVNSILGAARRLLITFLCPYKLFDLQF